MKRFLTDVFQMEGFNKVELFQDKSKVRANGNFSLPGIMKEFSSPEEAKAFIEGYSYAVQYYGGEVHHYMKEVDCE